MPPVIQFAQLDQEPNRKLKSIQILLMCLMNLQPEK